MQDLQKRLEDNDATLKSHRRELEVFRNCLHLILKITTILNIFQIYTNTRTKCISQKDASKRQQTQFFEEKSKKSKIVFYPSSMYVMNIGFCFQEKFKCVCNICTHRQRKI